MYNGFEMYYLILFIITIPAVWSLANPWYFTMHDFQHVARLHLLHQGLMQGQWYVRWVDVLGFNFGYPLFNFYPPLIYYIAELFNVFGLNLIVSIKSMIVIGYVAGAWGMYLLTRQALTQVQRPGRLDAALTNACAGVSAVLYTYFTYHAVLVYVRGAFAEFFGMAVVPYAYWSLERLRQDRSSGNIILFAVILALLILSHPFVAVPFLLFAGSFYFFFLFFTKQKWKFTMRLALSSVLGFGLSAFFWLPSYVERQYTLVNDILLTQLADFRIHFVYPQQLWYSPWGFGGSGQGFMDNMTFQLGKIHLGFAVLSVFLAVAFFATGKRCDRDVFARYIYYVAALVISIFLMVPASLPVWEFIQPIQYLQFPWRFLTFTSVFISIAGAYSFFYFAHFLSRFKWAKGIFYVIISIASLISVAVYGKYFHPEQYIRKSEGELTSFSEIAWNVSNSSFEFAPRGIALTKSRYGTSIVDIKVTDLTKAVFEISHPRATVQQLSNSFTKKTFRVTTPEQVDFTLNTFYFPGWAAYIDGKKVPISDNNRFKLITISIEQGNHSVEFRFVDTPIRFWAGIISLVSGAFVGLYLLLRLKKKRRH